MSRDDVTVIPPYKKNVLIEVTLYLQILLIRTIVTRLKILFSNIVTAHVILFLITYFATLRPLYTNERMTRVSVHSHNLNVSAISLHFSNAKWPEGRPGELSRYTDCQRAGRSGVRTPVGAKFSNLSRSAPRTIQLL